jgi:hypothetical protein
MEETEASGSLGLLFASIVSLLLLWIALSDLVAPSAWQLSKHLLYACMPMAGWAELLSETPRMQE